MKINKFLSWALTAALLFNASPVFSVVAKRDVKDPVLREIISELSGKVPKFIDKYGETLFVEDEAVTRGALLSALYEYDKRLKDSGIASESGSSPAVPAVSRQEFDNLKSKLLSLEKTSSKPAAAPRTDIASLISELDPNMPSLLDKNLKNSKVFRDLQKQVASASSQQQQPASSTSYAALSGEINDINKRIDALAKKINSASSSSYPSASNAEVEELKKTLLQIQKNYVALSGRIDDIKYASSLPQPDSSSSADTRSIYNRLDAMKNIVDEVPAVTSSLQKEITKTRNQTQSDIDRIERRLNNLSKSSSKGSSGGSSSASTIATISLGLTMVAALFAAR
ncbi:MAG: hypothetical protein LBQ47_04405 [Endomicrobium sp.]|jgi:predicted  nucleic acid-binding Zn-ribbon protein|nr:hypothetical protein [Endomicrobium sp.]